MTNYHATPFFPLARGKVRYVGEPVVGVVAESRYQAEDALELLAIDYEPLPLVIDPELAVRPGAPLLHEEAGTNVLVSREFKRGDVDAALRRRGRARAGRFRMHRKTPVAIEPRACLAEYEPGRDALTLHSATQVPGIVRDALAAALDMPGARSASSRPMSAAALAARARSIRKRFSSAPRRGSWPRGQMDQRPHGRPHRQQPGL